MFIGIGKYNTINLNNINDISKRRENYVKTWRLKRVVEGGDEEKKVNGCLCRTVYSIYNF